MNCVLFAFGEGEGWGMLGEWCFFVVDILRCALNADKSRQWC